MSASQPPALQGTVRSFNLLTHYGFIESECGDVFVHQRELRCDPLALRPGRRVRFQLRQTERGPQAVDVDLVDEEPTPRRRPTARGTPQVPEGKSLDVRRFTCDVPDELICTICCAVLSDPVHTTCEHLFCRHCIDAWLKLQPVCPVDRKSLTRDDLQTAPRFLRSLLGGLKLRCAFAEVGCESVVTVDELESHERGCSYREADDDCPDDSMLSCVWELKASPTKADKMTQMGRQLTSSVSTMTPLPACRSISTSTLEMKKASSSSTPRQRLTVPRTTPTPDGDTKPIENCDSSPGTRLTEASDQCPSSSSPRGHEATSKSSNNWSSHRKSRGRRSSSKTSKKVAGRAAVCDASSGEQADCPPDVRNPAGGDGTGVLEVIRLIFAHESSAAISILILYAMFIFILSLFLFFR